MRKNKEKCYLCSKCYSLQIKFRSFEYLQHISKMGETEILSDLPKTTWRYIRITEDIKIVPPWPVWLSGLSVP